MDLYFSSDDFRSLNRQCAVARDLFQKAAIVESFQATQQPRQKDVK